MSDNANEVHAEKTTILIGNNQPYESTPLPNSVNFELAEGIAWPYNVWTGPKATKLADNIERIDAEVENAIVKVLEGKKATDVIEHIFEDTAGKKWKLIEPGPEPIPFIPKSGPMPTTQSPLVDVQLMNILRAADMLATIMAMPTPTARDVKRLMNAINNNLEELANCCEMAAVSFRAMK